MTNTRSTARLADRLAAERSQRFVGRTAEQAAFRAALTGPDAAYAVLYVFGPGGVGKSALLAAYARIAAEQGVRFVLLDGRAFDPSPAGFMQALGAALDLSPARPPLDLLASLPAAVIAIDTYEQIAPLDGWLRLTFLPQLPAQVRVVIAGRNAPSAGWREDPGWQALKQVLPLRNLRPEESRAYLTGRAVPFDMHPGIVAATHGHPLALSLVTDLLAQQDNAQQADALRLAEHPDIVRALLERLVQSTPSPLHRRALEVCAHARSTTEGLLAEVLELDDAGELFAWLRDLSCITIGPEGLAPHDLARDVLAADLRWRDPDAYRRMHAAVRRAILRRVQRSQGLDQQRAIFDLLFLHRESPVMRPYYRWSMLGDAWSEPATADDHPTILQLVQRDRGPEQAAIVAYWLQRMPQAFIAFRSQHSRLIGFTCMLVLDAFTEDDLHHDPGLAAAAAFIARRAPLRPGETLLYCRITLAQAALLEDDASGVQDLAAAVNIAYWLGTPRLAWSFIAQRTLEYWYNLFQYVRQPHTPEADFQIAGQPNYVFSHDWRAEPPYAWLDVMSDREFAPDARQALLDPPPTTPLLVLSRPEFDLAVRQALRDYARPDALALNPLMRSRLVRGTPGHEPEPEALRQLLRTAAEELRAEPRSERFFRAVNRTYLSPAPTQEQAAEQLGVPFSTYRYHLTNGIDRIAERLWQQELTPPE